MGGVDVNGAAPYVFMTASALMRLGLFTGPLCSEQWRVW